MTESTSHLSIRIIFSNPPVPGQGSESKYRWDRIVFVSGALVLIAALAIKMMLPSPPAAKIVEPVKVSVEHRAVFYPDTAGPQSTVQDIVESVPVSTTGPQTVPEAEPQPVLSTRTSAIIPGPTRILSDAVQRFVLTNAVKGNEPVGGPDAITSDNASNGVIKLYAYSQVKQLPGEKLIYRWLRDTAVVANVVVTVGSDDWRSHASKYLSKDMRGPWRVELRTGKGELLAFAEFEY